MTSNFPRAHEKLINLFYPQKPMTIAELPKEKFLAFRAVSQGNDIKRGCVR